MVTPAPAFRRTHSFHVLLPRWWSPCFSSGRKRILRYFTCLLSLTTAELLQSFLWMPGTTWIRSIRHFPHISRVLQRVIPPLCLLSLLIVTFVDTATELAYNIKEFNDPDSRIAWSVFHLPRRLIFTVKRSGILALEH